MISGSIVALITPFTESRVVDFLALEDLIKWQIEEGSDGLVLCGSTGEGSSLSFEEKCAIFEMGAKIGKGKIFLIANTGTNQTKESVALTQEAKKLGLQGLSRRVETMSRNPGQVIRLSRQARRNPPPDNVLRGISDNQNYADELSRILSQTTKKGPNPFNRTQGNVQVQTKTQTDAAFDTIRFGARPDPTLPIKQPRTRRQRISRTQPSRTPQGLQRGASAPSGARGRTKPSRATKPDVKTQPAAITRGAQQPSTAKQRQPLAVPLRATATEGELQTQAVTKPVTAPAVATATAPVEDDTLTRGTPDKSRTPSEENGKRPPPEKTKGKPIGRAPFRLGGKSKKRLVIELKKDDQNLFPKKVGFKLGKVYQIVDVSDSSVKPAFFSKRPIGIKRGKTAKETLTILTRSTKVPTQRELDQGIIKISVSPRSITFSR